MNKTFTTALAGEGKTCKPRRRPGCTVFAVAKGGIYTAAKPPPSPQRQSRCRPLSEANITLLHNLRRQARPLYTPAPAATTTLGP